MGKDKNNLQKTIKNKTASMRSQIRQCNEWIRAPWSLPRGGGQSLILGWPSLFHSPPSSLNENPTECSLTWEDTGNVRDLCLMLPVFPTQAKRSMLSLHDSQSEIGPSFLKVALLCSSFNFSESCGRFQNKDQFYWLISRALWDKMY